MPLLVMEAGTVTYLFVTAVTVMVLPLVEIHMTCKTPRDFVIVFLFS